ncbi:MAG: glycoside hydrolase family 3 protein [Treponemataceae bacterium]|nr:glycoside hydrolase family 3 protein [Treponemataceae bacterium]
MKCLKKVLLFSVLLILADSILFSVEIPENATFWSDYPNEELADFLVDNMTNEELLAQILMFGWAGSEPSQLVMDWIEMRSLGSLKVYGWGTNNVEDVAKSVIQVQSASDKTRFRIPLYIATDQEGGWIRHIKGETSDTPGNLAIGASGQSQDAFYTGYYIAKELRALGVNMNFAPTVDIYTNMRSSVIGPRSFGSDAENTAVLGASFTAGMMKAGVIPTAKHFPGHGDTRFDSHGRLPEIQITKDVLESRELLPFKYLIEENVPAIMAGHLSFPKITGSNVPATLSKYFLTDFLRGELGYKGLIITDDMMMNGATIYAGNLTRAFRMAIEAGNDIIISSTTAQLNEGLWTSNLEYMSYSEEFKNTVKKAARHVILSKLNYFKGANAVPIYPDLDKVLQNVPDPDGVKFFTSQACKSITAYNKNPSEYKIDAENSSILIAGQYQDFLSSGLKKFPDAGTFYYSYYDSIEESDTSADLFYDRARKFDTIILGCASKNSEILARQAERLAKAGKKVIIVSMLAPIYFMDDEWESSILMCYSYSPYSFKAVFSVLAGEFEPKGQLPLKY